MVAMDWAHAVLMLTVLGLAWALLRADARARRHADRVTRTLADQAFRDPLTGLPNRALFLDRLGVATARAARSGASVGLLVVDLDHFGTLNDRYGQRVGDEVLRQVANLLRGTIRASDTAARLEKDTFAVLCEDLADPAEALNVARRIADVVAAPHAGAGCRPPLRITCSLGVAVSVPDRDPEDTEILLREAIAAVQRAKVRGRGRVEVFDQALRDQTARRHDIERGLATAVTGREFRLVYQPIVDVATGGVIGVEALLRWEHPDRGTISPAEFIPIAESTGLIVPIGRWVLSQALEQAAAWRLAFPEHPLAMAVNLSGRQLGDPDLVATVAELLHKTGAPHRSLVLEITESVLIEATETTGAVLHALRSLGVGLALDDFGTEYSSLTYLRRFPFDVLKVDRSFVAGLGVDAEDTTIVAAVTGLARSLGLVAVAEGVETIEQLEALRAIGCDRAQGYLFARPGPPEAIDDLLKNLAAGTALTVL